MNRIERDILASESGDALQLVRQFLKRAIGRIEQARTQADFGDPVCVGASVARRDERGAASIGDVNQGSGHVHLSFIGRSVKGGDTGPAEMRLQRLAGPASKILA